MTRATDRAGWCAQRGDTTRIELYVPIGVTRRVRAGHVEFKDGMHYGYVGPQWTDAARLPYPFASRAQACAHVEQAVHDLFGVALRNDPQIND